MAYTITPLTEHTGAEVRGLDLTKPVDAETRAALNRAFAKHHVLVVRDQTYEPADFLEAVQLWGELQPHDKKEMHVPGYPQMYYVSNEQTVPGKRYISGETFHTDHSNHPAPPKATILYAVSLPSQGGDTQYVNMHQAYDQLPAATTRRVRSRVPSPSRTAAPVSLASIAVTVCGASSLRLGRVAARVSSARRNTRFSTM